PEGVDGLQVVQVIGGVDGAQGGPGVGGGGFELEAAGLLEGGEDVFHAARGIGAGADGAVGDVPLGGVQGVVGFVKNFHAASVPRVARWRNRAGRVSWRDAQCVGTNSGDRTVAAVAGGGAAGQHVDFRRAAGRG